VRRGYAVPLYAMIPRRSGSEATCWIFSSLPQCPFAEAFRLLRGNLYQSVSGQKSRVVLVTSSTSADGKTSACCWWTRICAAAE